MTRMLVVNRYEMTEGASPIGQLVASETAGTTSEVMLASQTRRARETARSARPAFRLRLALGAKARPPASVVDAPSRRLPFRVARLSGAILMNLPKQCFWIFLILGACGGPVDLGAPASIEG